MIRRADILLCIFATAFITSGCVSTGEFETMQSNNNAAMISLKDQKFALEEQASILTRDNISLQQRLTTQELDYQTLQQQLAYHETDNTKLLQMIATLERQKSKLIAASMERQQQYGALTHSLAAEIEKGQLKVRKYQNMLAVDLAEQIFFDSGKTTLKEKGKEVLSKVGEALKSYDDKVIHIVGHTDNIPMTKSLNVASSANWELSVARATSVARHLQEVGIPPERLMPSGRGGYDPVASNGTAEGRQKNRRIEIMLIDKNLLGKNPQPGMDYPTPIGKATEQTNAP
jgi:chemotaxis protein MotB